jgi:hypothetical protein
MTIINRAGQTAIPVVQVREVNADPLGRDRSWVEERQSQGATSYSVIPITIEEERRQEPSKRAAVGYFDLLKWGGLTGNSVEDVLEWVRHYRTALRSDEVPASLIAVGKKVVAKDRRRLAKAGIHYLNEERRRFQRPMGVGDRGIELL